MLLQPYCLATETARDARGVRQEHPDSGFRIRACCSSRLPRLGTSTDLQLSPVPLAFQWDQRLLTFDTKAITYVMSQASELYPKPGVTRRMLCRLLGEGVPFTEGESLKKPLHVKSMLG